MDHGLSEVLGGEDLARFHRGDETLLLELIDVYSPRLQPLVRLFARQPADASDLLQETWQQVCLERTSYSGTGPLLGWCYGVPERLPDSSEAPAGALSDLGIGCGDFVRPFARQITWRSSALTRSALATSLH